MERSRALAWAEAQAILEQNKIMGMTLSHEATGPVDVEQMRDALARHFWNERRLETGNPNGWDTIKAVATNAETRRDNDHIIKQMNTRADHILRVIAPHLAAREQALRDEVAKATADCEHWRKDYTDLQNATQAQGVVDGNMIVALTGQLAIAHASGVAEERERCAKLCEATGMEHAKAVDLEWDAIKSNKLLWCRITANGLAAAIRAGQGGEK